MNVNEIEDIPVETVAGDRPSSLLGERLMIALAVLALLGGLLIAGANLLDGMVDDGVAAGSPGASPGGAASAGPSRTPPPTASPRPPREVTVVPGSPQPVPEYVPGQIGWLEAVGEVEIRSGPSRDAGSRVHLMVPGELALAEQSGPTDGWLRLHEPKVGWANLLDADGRIAARFHPLDELSPGGVHSLVAGPDALVALAWPPARQQGPPQAFVATSTDGLSWSRTADAPFTLWHSWSAAWGPSGWLAVTIEETGAGPATWIWESPNGRSWSSLGSVDVSGVWSYHILGSSLGYLLVAAGGPAPGSQFWFSPDGITWQESRDSLGGELDLGFYQPDRRARVMASDAGFFAWSAGPSGGTGPRVAYSADGRTWSEIPVDPAPGSNLQLAAAGDTLLGLGSAPDGTTYAWRARLDDGTSMRLVRDPDAERVLAGTAVTALESNGVVAVAMSVEVRNGAASAWTSSGNGWERLPLPPGGVGVVPQQLAVTSEAIVVVGAAPGEVAENPVFWRYLPGDGWRVEPTPIVPPLPEPDARQCGALPDSALEFAILSPLYAPVCFGDREITFRVWSAPCDWCGAGPSRPGHEGWLRDPAHTLLFSPIESSSGWARDAVVHPDLGWDAAWTDAWLEVTGHFADEAAADCPVDVEPLLEGWFFYSPRVEVNYCRQRFVVTQLAVVDGP